jgi:hypothetical protein
MLLLRAKQASRASRTGSAQSVCVANRGQLVPASLGLINALVEIPGEQHQMERRESWADHRTKPEQERVA